MNEIKNFYDEVARAAYELYEKRGRIHGCDLSDWLEAEMIVKKRYEKEMTGAKAKSSGKAKPKNSK